MLEHINPGTIIAFARIDSGDDGEDAVSAITNENGDITGFNVECMIIQGVYANLRTVALLSCPPGSEVPDYPMPGTTLLLAFTERTHDVGAVVIAQMPGGSRPIPKAAAGIAIDDAGLGKVQVRQPPKGVGIRFYMRGAAFVVRLKGAQDGYAGEFYVEADDAANSPDGKTGTFMRIVRTQSSVDPTKMVFMAKIRDAAGASVACVDGAVVMSSPNGLNQLQCGDDGFAITATSFSVQANQLLKLDGATVAINMTSELIPFLIPGSNYAALRGNVGASGLPSSSVFIGGLL